MYAPSRDIEADLGSIEIECRRCRGTGEDRHGEDCGACDGFGTVLSV